MAAEERAIDFHAELLCCSGRQMDKNISCCDARRKYTLIAMLAVIDARSKS